MREIALLREINHKNIVKYSLETSLVTTFPSLKDIVLENKTLFLVFEYLEMDLKKHIDSLKKDQFLDSLSLKVTSSPLPSITLLKKFLYQLLEGTAACHSRRVLHRDLKPQNLLLNSKGNMII